MSLSQFQGSILGLAIGDALGFPVEFRSRRQILELLGPAGVTDLLGIQDPRLSGRAPYIIGATHPAGTYSDDTQMSLATARGLLTAGGADLDTLMETIGREYVAWSISDDNDRAPGSTCMTGCRNLAQGTPWREAGVARSKGCGSAMRVAPIGLYYGSDLDRVEAVARASSLLTHGHDAAIEGAAAAALLVALAVAGVEPAAMYAEVMRRCGGRSPDFDRCLHRLPDLLSAPPEVALSKAGLGEAWVAEEAVASALYCVWRHPDDLRACLLEGANTDGDSDSIAAIAGSISGARLGLGGIPADWVARVEGSAALHAVGESLWNARWV